MTDTASIRAQAELLLKENRAIIASFAGGRGNSESVARLCAFVSRLETAVGLLGVFAEMTDQVTLAMELAMTTANLTGDAAEPFLMVEHYVREVASKVGEMRDLASLAKANCDAALASVKPIKEG